MTNNSGETVRVDCAAAAAGNVPAAALPPMTLKRWVARRKTDIIAAVEGGFLTEFEALAAIQHIARGIFGLDSRLSP